MEEAEEEYDSSMYVAGEEAFDDNSEDIYDILITNQVGRFATLVVVVVAAVVVLVFLLSSEDVLLLLSVMKMKAKDCDDESKRL